MPPILPSLSRSPNAPILSLLEHAERSVGAAKAGRPAQQALRLGLTTSVEAGVFCQLIAALEQSRQLSVTYAPSPRLVAGLRAGRLDAALIALPTQTFDLTVRELAQQALVAAVPSRHPLARRRRLSLKDIGGETVYWFSRARQPAFFDHCHAIFSEHGFRQAFAAEPEDHHVLIADIAAGKGIALLPESFAALKLAGVAYRKLEEGDELAIGLGLAYREGARLPAALLEAAQLN